MRAISARMALNPELWGTDFRQYSWRTVEVFYTNFDGRKLSVELSNRSPYTSSTTHASVWVDDTQVESHLGEEAFRFSREAAKSITRYISTRAEEKEKYDISEATASALAALREVGS